MPSLVVSDEVYRKFLRLKSELELVASRPLSVSEALDMILRYAEFALASGPRFREFRIKLTRLRSRIDFETLRIAISDLRSSEEEVLSKVEEVCLRYRTMG
ncbi:MAG: hypothetical protein DRJ40_03720 [Thermoprotei archaeon]|nr:MAG: hypothetical protein DRJ40_03720 [Thermoprotei archaeon]